MIDYNVVVPKLINIVNAGLSSGLGEPVPGKMCVEAAVCYALGLPHSDDPGCVAKSFRSLKISLNDQHWSSNEARAKGMLRLAIAQLGSRDVVSNVVFRKMVAEMTIRKILPLALRHVGLNKEADRCEAEGTTKSARMAGRGADAANAASAADAASAALAAFALYAASAASAALDTLAADAADAASYAANAASAALDARATDVAIRTKDILNPSDISKMYKYLIEILEGAFAIGNQSTLADVCKVNERLETAKQLVKENS